MRVTITCESSGTVRDAFKELGHDSTSLDLLATETPGKHIIKDVIAYLESVPDKYFDLLGAHPECTKLCVSGNHVYAKGKPKHAERLAQIKWTENLWRLIKLKSKSGYLENPIGVLTTSSNLPKPQYIQPFYFGEDASKKTALFLHNLPELKPTFKIKGRLVEWPKGSGLLVERFANQLDSGQNRLGPSENRWALRSKTYPGIAKAMAEQWTEFLEDLSL